MDLKERFNSRGPDAGELARPPEEGLYQWSKDRVRHLWGDGPVEMTLSKRYGFCI